MRRQNATKSDTLTAAQARYVAARLIRSQKLAAEACEVTQRTAQRWERLPAVRRALRAHVDATLADSARQAAAMQAAALAAIAQILADKTAPGPLRLAAARAVLEHAPRLVEASDNAARLAEIEARLDDLDTSRHESRNSLKLA